MRHISTLARRCSAPLGPFSAGFSSRYLVSTSFRSSPAASAVVGDAAPAQVPDVDEVVQKLTNTFRFHFISGLRKPRTVGREAEFPVVNASDGSAADVRQLLARIDSEGDMRLMHQGDHGLYNDEYEYSLEVGTGTVEVIVGPCDTLQQLQDVHDRATLRLARVAGELGMKLLGCGMQPVTPRSASLLAPRKRYAAIHQSLGDSWLWFTTTASDQLHVDICEPELLRQINAINLLTPTVIGLCGNSSIYNGAVSEFISTREGVGHRDINASCVRHGMANGPFYSVLDYVSSLCSMPMIVRPRTRREMWENKDLLLPVERNMTFFEHIERFGFDLDAWNVHDHYIWNSARPRTVHGTMELRSACQQPWEDRMVVAALSLGMVEAAREILMDPVIRPLLDWGRQRALLHQVTAYGLADVEGSAVPDLQHFMNRVLDLVSTALRRRGNGEEEYLAPLYQRVEAKKNPGQVGVEIFRDGGLRPFLDHFALPSGVSK